MAIANGENDMDKNEVLKTLETAKDENGEVPMRLVRQAFEKLPEPCGDTIYRQDAIDGVKTLHDVAWKNWHEPTLSANVVLDMIGELPSAQPERPTGEWLRMSDLSEKDDNRYKCSRCGNVIHHKSRMDLYTFNSWCGRCGSDNSRHTT